MEKWIPFDFIAFVTMIGLFHYVAADVCGHNTCLDTSGQHFIVTIPSIGSRVDCDCQIHIASMQNGFARMRNYIATKSEEIANFTLTKGVTAYGFNGKSLLQEQPGTQTRAFEVVSTVDVRIYVSCDVNNDAGAFVVLPTTFYGRKYVWSSYKTFYSIEDNILIITSIHNDTRVEIKNITQSSNRNETLNQYVSLAITTTSDPNVTVISSDKPVNVVSGCMCTMVPINHGNCDTMYDSPIPVEYWGNEFIVPPMVSKSGYVVRIYTNSSNTTIRLQYNNGFENKSMSFSSMMELILKNHTTVIVTDYPVAVVQYGFTGVYDNTIGDSFMASVPAVKHFSKDYVFPTVFAGKQYTHRIAVTIATSGVNGLVLNGRSLSAVASFALWSVPHPLSDYSVLTVDLPEDNYTLVHRSSDVRFSVLYYGLKQYYGFGYYLGFSFPLTETDQCASNPCMNGGTCVDNKTQFSCICPVAFTGPSCEHALPTMLLPLGNLMCFRCEDTSSLAFCDTVESCKSNEVCFLERFTTPERHVRFRSGCMDNQTCSLQNQTNVVQQATCLDCCDVNFCNSQGCGDAGFPPPASRGPICLDCAHVKHPTQCDQVTLCASNELCYAEEVKWGAESLFHLGCKSDHQCAFESRSAVTRAVPVCRNCCHGDFCNQNCTAPDNHQSPIIVG